MDNAPRKLAYALPCALMASCVLLTATHADEDASAFATMSLEEMLSTEITTLSRKAENLGGAPAAVHVITQSDIRRSGYRSIPDLLRLVPGMQVAQLDANKWAVTARGANGRFANKLLVLMDGRTLYDPTLSGVYWEIQDTDLTSIERIEVIRGPGATMWGSNAVNGVVNIITKHAGDTQSELLSVVGGSGGNEATIRLGGSNGNSAYRVFAKVSEFDGNVNVAGDPVEDDSNMQRIGGRYDWDGDNGRALTITAEAFTGESGDYRINRYFTPPFERIETTVSDVWGGFVNAQWSAQLSETSAFDVKAYYLSDNRKSSFYANELDTFDIDIQHRFRLGDRHNMIWGANYRTTSDELPSTSQTVFTPVERRQTLFSAFIQDDVSYLDDRLRVIVGSKFEYNSFSPRNVEVSPSARMSFAWSETTTLWAALSRAVRIPSRGELQGSAVTSVLPPGQPELTVPVPLVSTIDGNPVMRSEVVIAKEAGIRIRGERSVLDVALFHNSFDELRSFSLGAPTCEPSGTLLPVDPLCLATADFVKVPLNIGNKSNVDTLGAEISWSHDITDSWRIQANYTFIETRNRAPDTGDTAALAIEEDSPDNQFFIRSSANLAEELEFDIFARWVDELRLQGIDAYTAVDIRLAWSPMPSWTFSLLGRNLGTGDHVEFLSELSDLAPVQIEPTGFLEVRWNF